MKRLWKHHKWILSLVLVALIGVGATSAYLMASSGSVKNTFATGTVQTDIVEVLEGEKTVTVKNTGDLPVYVRARIVVGGANTDQVEYTYSAPAATALAESDKVYVVLANPSDWQQASGRNDATDWYYYTKDSLKTGEETSALMLRVLIGGKANVDTAHFEVTVTQESVVIGNDPLTTADQIKEAFEAR